MNSNIFAKLKQINFSTYLKYFFIGLIVIGIVGIGILSGVFFGYIDTAGKISPQQLKVTDSKTTLYDISGSEFEVIYGSENREWVDINKMPVEIKQAFIAIEDERFYSHHGIDFRRIGGAVISAITPGGKTYGASTITQQLVKNLTGEKEFSLKRKIQEQWRSIQLERDLTKDQILELYLNIVPLSNGINGVQAASKAYFDKDVSELSLAECASLAAITKLPTYYDPFLHPDNNKKRQEDILFKMKDLGFIQDQSTYDKAISEKLAFKKTAIEKVSNHSYFTDQVISDVVRDLQSEKGYSKVLAEKMIYGGGLKIYTTADSSIQKAMDNVYSEFNVQVGSDTIQSAMVILDPKNGQIRGLIGGVGEKKGKRTFNRATQALRSPGSSIKPIAVYAPAIEKGIITPSSVFDDSPMKIGDWEPHNYDMSYRGPITIRAAVTNSINIVAIKVLQKLGFENSYTFLRRLGIDTLQVSDMDYAPLALGALTKGVSPLNMAAAYAPFANHGVYIKPYIYTSVVDSEGNIILDNKSVDSRAVMTENTAYVMTDLLQGVVTYGTGASARLSKMPAAGKTGTASDMKDKWFVGYTPYYVGAVWYGFDKEKELPSSTWNNSLKIWKNVMEQVHSKLPYKNFDAPKGVTVDVAVCSLSGKRATHLCGVDMNGSAITYKQFKKGEEPQDYCDLHKAVDICKESNKVATEYCPDELVEQKSVSAQTDIASMEKCKVHTAATKKNNQTKNNNYNETDSTYPNYSREDIFGNGEDE